MLTLIATVPGLLLLAAFIVCLLAGVNRAPLWPAVLLVILANLIALLLGTRVP